MQSIDTLNEVFEQCKKGLRGNFVGRGYSPEKWDTIQMNVSAIIQASNKEAEMDEMSIYHLIATVAEICNNNPKGFSELSFRGIELLQLATFVNSCRI